MSYALIFLNKGVALRAADGKNAFISGIATGHFYVARNRTFLIGGNT
jgi:hypothetical protein